MSTSPRLITLILLSALAVLPLNIIVPSLPAIAGSFSADYALVNVAIAGYAIVGALTQLFAGRLSDRYGRRPVVLAALAVFIVASIGCATATSVETFLFFRALQAVVSATYAVSLAILQDGSGADDATRLIGKVATAWALAPMVGPTLGGAIDQLLGWRAVFWLLALLGAAALALAGLDLRETARRAGRRAVTLRAAYGTLLGAPLFLAIVACMIGSIATFYLFLGGAPLVGEPLLGGSTVALGLWMGLVPAGFLFGNFLSSRAAIAARPMRNIVIGRAVTCAGLALGLVLAWLGPLHAAAFFVPCIALGVGNGLTMPAASARAMAVRPDLAGTAAGLASATTQAGAAAIAAIAGFLLPTTGGTVALLATMLATAMLALAAGAQAARLVARADAERCPAPAG